MMNGVSQRRLRVTFRLISVRPPTLRQSNPMTPISPNRCCIVLPCNEPTVGPAVLSEVSFLNDPALIATYGDVELKETSNPSSVTISSGARDEKWKPFGDADRSGAALPETVHRNT